VERFNHDLPSLAFGVPSWGGLSAGESGQVTIVLALDERGELAARGHEALTAERCESRRASPVEARCARTRAAYESVRRTIDGLYGRFELPGSPPGAGQVRLGIVATVSGVATGGPSAAAAADQPVEVGSTPIADKRASAHFVRSDGQRVDFALQILAVDAAPADPAAGSTGSAAGATPSAASASR
jgi:hypothetical protein